MNLGRLLSGRGMGGLRNLGAELAHDPATLMALDKQLMGSNASGRMYTKVMPAYSKYVAKPAAFSGAALYGSKFDNAKLLATLGGTMGGIRYGGEFSRPLYDSLTSLATKINPQAMAHYGKGAAPDSVINIIKPAMAITSKPLMYMDEALNLGLNMAEHPILSSVALPFTLYGAARGGGALLSRLGRGRRLAQLRQGIAPRAYYNQARQLGYK